MKKNYFLIGLMMLLVAFVAMDASAQQRYVDVDPGIGTLNDAINSDTTDAGERVDENTIYRLQRGNVAYYGLTGSISNSGYPLTIMAADGDGARPFLQPRDEGDESARAFRPKGDLTLMGLHVTNLDQLGGQPTRMIRASKDDITVIVDDCWFDRDGQSFIRVDNPGMTFKITNSIISNIGYPSDPSNGRGIDDRGNQIDTIIMENNTFYNITFAIVRDDGGELNYVRFSNNTVVNLGQRGIEFGPTAMLEANNNIFMNTGFMPVHVDSPGEIFTVDSIGDVAPTMAIDGNVIWTDSTLFSDWLNDTSVVRELLNPTLEAWMMETNGTVAIIAEEIDFTDGPPANDSMVIYAQDPELNQDDAPFWEDPEIPGDDAGGNGLYHLDVPYDFGYVNSVAYNLGTNDMPIGDGRWMAENGVFEMVDFERDYEDNLWGPFANDGDSRDDIMLMANPDMSGINTSSQAFWFNVLPGADPWAGVYSDSYGKMEFTQEMHHMTMMVYKEIISNCGLKVESGGTTTELKVPNTLTGEWELITFDFSANIGETLTRLVFFPDFPDSREAGSVSYVDNIKMVTAPVGVKKYDAVSLSVYPNPANDLLNVQAEGMTSITVLDVLGKSVKAIQLQGEDRATISVEDLNQGVYFITIEATGGSKTTKFLKK
ncbi:MAG: T9SS type A sorting domain-containing protein [Bacteroides sp.]|nr:T9SS type A sorting domain-containing protein [Bacteroides sp.]